MDLFVNTASRGIVYILTNPAMPGLVKIGRTGQKDLDKRLSQLYSTGVPVPFDCAFAGVVSDELAVESAFHKAFGPYRLNPKREFFKIEPEQATALLEILVDEEVTNQVSERAAQVDPESKKASEKLRRPNFNFKEMGIPEGAELEFLSGGEHRCHVLDDRHVEYKGETLRMTALTVRLLNAPRDVAPLRHWSYENQRLSEIYEETY